MFFMFVVLFVFILVPHHKSRESMKIEPHPWGHPLSIYVKETRKHTPKDTMGLV
jgi:hypothetical protein